MYQQMLMMQQQMLQMAKLIDPKMADTIAAGITGGTAPAPADGGEAPSANVEDTEALGGDEKSEASNTKKARQRVAESTSPT
jgi:hypothetical protein